jgi:RNA polymerase sigma-70 factor, ECF subfamily
VPGVEEQGSIERDELVRQLTRGMAEGSDRAFALFHNSYFDRIFRHLLVQARGDEHLARELTQQIYLRLVRHAREFQTEALLWSWLKQTARSCLVDHLRRNGKTITVELEVLDSLAASIDPQGDDELHEALDSGLAEIDPEERQLIELSYFDGLPHQEIATRLDLTPKAVEGRLARTRAKLRGLLLKALKAYALF